MKGSTIAFLLEFGLFFGAALGFAFWQLRSLKKLKREREAREAEERDER